MILLGSTIGIYFGWVNLPQRVQSTRITNLRSDYQADYVLMAAESYEIHENLSYTTSQLVLLGDEPTLKYIQKAIMVGEKIGYSATDIEKLAKLAKLYQSPAEGVP